MARKTIRVGYLSRVEGEARLELSIRDGTVRAARLAIFESPRFFEAFLRGRHYEEAVDINARICGICPVAYQMSTVHAVEDAFGIRVEGPLRALRRLIYCGEWIESHALHVYMLHAPDFLGYESAVAMARDHPQAVTRGLALKKAGNELLAKLGGREIHPVNVRVGGFYRVPRKRELRALRDPLERARELALETVRWTAGFDFPESERPYTFVALRHGREYPFNEGRVASSDGLDVPVQAFDAHFEEYQVRHSTALRSRIRGVGHYLTGPLARYHLNADLLRPVAREAAREVGLGASCRNPYMSILVRSVEVLHACDEALAILAEYEEPDAPRVAVEPCVGVGHGATEAPRGLLYHRYVLDAEGLIREARIVPPTAQNQAVIEEDLVDHVQRSLDLPDEALRHRCERTVRNHDPCISCATHFLKLEIDRG